MNHLIVFESGELHSVCELNHIEDENFAVDVKFNPPLILQAHYLSSPNRWIEPSSGAKEITDTIGSFSDIAFDRMLELQLWSIIHDVRGFRDGGYGNRETFKPLAAEYARYGVIV